MEIRVADAFEILFEVAEDSGVSSMHTQYVLRKKAATLGLVAGRRVPTGRLEDFMHERLHQEIMKRHNLEIKTMALSDFLRGERPLRNPLHNAVLISALYDSPSEFISEIHDARLLAESELHNPTGYSRKYKPTGTVKHVDRYLRELTDYIEQNPGATRSQARGSIGYSMRALEHVLPGAIEQILPAQKTGRKPSRHKENLIARDVAFAAEVRRRRAEFERSPPPFRVTQARLIVGWRNHRSVFRYKSEMPRTVAAIEECKETLEQYIKRKSSQGILAPLASNVKNQPE
ncbi:hypothetical protein [Paraburkholderia dipogonis]|uniref:hypothetical protein n=1 Tax=Paraburkholderia dipogonis TaxID=1211383 RepID=UPI0038B8777A